MESTSPTKTLEKEQETNGYGIHNSWNTIWSKGKMKKPRNLFENARRFQLLICKYFQNLTSLKEEIWNLCFIIWNTQIDKTFGWTTTLTLG